MGKRLRSAALVFGLIGTQIVWLATGAVAACHSFTIEVSPETVQEGSSVTVTVSRDAARADSNITVVTSAGTAESETDFSPLDEQIDFTGSETERTLEIDVVSDDVAEGSEDFTVALSEPGGCSVNPNFQVAQAQTVTIEADEAAQGGPVEETAPEPGETADETEDAADEDDGLPVALIVVLVLLVVAAAAFAMSKRRPRP
ncbi:MAG: Calx-beta domain-containing protein [Actinomycetota bacterium]